MALLFSVYVTGGFTEPSTAATLFARNHLEGKGDLLLAAGAEERILGTVLLLNAESELRQVARPGESEFRLLAVASTARREGIGRKLVAECLRRAARNGAERMVLSTQPSMNAAHALYEELGFRRNPERDWQTAGGGFRWVYTVELDRTQ